VSRNDFPLPLDDHGKPSAPRDPVQDLKDEVAQAMKERDEYLAAERVRWQNRRHGKG
jgi:hypothetical protein